MIKFEMAETFTGELDKILTAINGIIVGLVVLKCILIFMNNKSNNTSLVTTLEQVKKVVLAGVIALFIPEFIDVLTLNGYFKVISSYDVFPFLLRGIGTLIKSLTAAVAALAVTLTVFNVAKEIVGYMTATDELKAQHKENAKTAFIKGICAAGCSGVISTIMGYFI